MKETTEYEVSPGLPTSAQILGVLVKNLGLNDYRLSSRTARRFFSGQLENVVKDSSRAEILDAIADALAELGFETNLLTSADTSVSALVAILDWYAVQWDRLRTFLLPRMQRVYPSHLADVWQAYLRLAAIDLAIRSVAILHLKQMPEATLDFLNCAIVSRRGKYLNQLRKSAEVSVLDFVEAVEVTQNTVDAWLYKGSRPYDEHLAKIASVLSSGGESNERKSILRELRMLYWLSAIAEALGNHVGTDVVDDLVCHMHDYALLVYRALDNESVAKLNPIDIEDLVILGASSRFSQPLLAELMNHETDDKWKNDISAVDSDWVGRVLTVNYEVYRSEEDALIEETDGKILKNWDISNPRAYEHYQRSMELQLQGKKPEAIAEVEKAVELDPLDPANHLTLGSAKGYIGVMISDDALINEALNACWTAVSLDPNWILPWTEIGKILLGSGRTVEAVEHLRSISSECGPLDAGYYYALGVALHQCGEFADALVAFDTSLTLNPDDPQAMFSAATDALLVGDGVKSTRYRKMAGRLGLSEDLKRGLGLVKDPANAMIYLTKGKTHFTNGEDRQALSYLNVVLQLHPKNVDVLLLRGMVHGYMNQYEMAITDLSEVIRLAPENDMAYYRRGLAYGEQDAFDLAIADLSQALRLNADHGDAYRARGDAYRYKREYDLAIADYDSAIRINVEDATSYRGRGVALRMKGNFDLAIADFNIAIMITPEDPFAYRFRGDAYLAKGDYGRAVADFDATLKIDDTDEVAYRGRGNARLFNGELELAVADYNMAIECDSAGASAYYGRGLARELMRDAEEAENDFRRARELGYDDSV